MGSRRLISSRLGALAILACTALVAACGDDTGPSPVERAEAERDRTRREVTNLRNEIAFARTDPGAQEPRGAVAQGSGIFSAADRRSFDALARRLSGREGVAVSGLGREQRTEQLGRLTTAVAWSTAKVPVAMAAIDADVGTSGDLRRAITASDNAAAERLWSALGGGRRAAAAATAELRAAGDMRTRIQSRRLRSGFTAFGQTSWGLADQARFTAGMPCSAEGRRVLGLMGQVVAGQRWGLGASGGGGARYKGGWGPGVTPGAADGWIDRQMGTVTVDGRALVVTLMSDGPGHSAGTMKLTSLARWVVSHASTDRLPSRPRC